MEGETPSLWERSRLVRALTYASVASALISGFAAWHWRVDPPLGVLVDGYYESVAKTACLTFWLVFVPVIAVLQFVRGFEKHDE